MPRREPFAQGLWEKGAAAYDQAFADGILVNSWELFENAILRLAVNDVAGYQATRSRMLPMLREHNTQQWMEFTAHAYVLAPIKPAEREEALRMAASRALVSANPVVRSRDRTGTLPL